MVRLRADAAASHASYEFWQWYTANGSLSTILPVEAHYKLGAVQRRHTLLREAWRGRETSRSATGGELINQALAYVPVQQNTLQKV